MSKTNRKNPPKSSSKKSRKQAKSGKWLQVFATIFLSMLVICVAGYIVLNVRDVAREPVPQSLSAGDSSAESTASRKSAPKQKKKSARSKKSKKDSAARQSTSARQQSRPQSQAQSGQARATQSSGAQLISLSPTELRPERDLLPRFMHEYRSQVIRHTGYVVSYNADYKVPNWVLYELNYAETLGNMPRNNCFDVDPEVPEREMAQLTDYRNSGYDRGHMAPNADLNWDRQAQDECFYLSNMCPQGHDFNAGIWLDLESQVREWAERDSAITIVCGPVLPRTAQQASRMKKIGKGRVLVPEYFYKVLLVPFDGEPRAIGFIMPNHNEKVGRRNRPLSDYAVTVDSVESLTGIDFFPALPDRVENKIESSYNLNIWFE